MICWLARLGCGGSLLLWMGLIFYLSSLPEGTGSHPSAVAWALQPQDNPLLGNLKSVAGHLILYGVLAGLFLANIWSWRTMETYHLRWAAAAAALASLYGVSDELHQWFVAGRSASLYDALVNIVAAAAVAMGLRYMVYTWADDMWAQLRLYKGWIASFGAHLR